MLAGLFTLILILGVALPSEFYVEKSITINAPVEKVFEQVNNLKNWEKWSPWGNEDPSLKINYGRPISGMDANYSWKGDNVGEGSMRIIESIPNKSLKTSVDFGNRGRGKGIWSFSRRGNLVTVTAGFKGYAKNFPQKFFGLVAPRILGPQITKGLLEIKKLTERN